jgi:DNA repair/transcription protein MET18/MMS19
MGGDFVIGITDLVSGEKDPRNLMIIFSMLRVVIVEWDIVKYTEVMVVKAVSFGVVRLTNF